MIRAVTKGKEGEPVVILGITRDNIERLKRGHPIAVDLSEFGLALRGAVDHTKVTVLYGETHEEVVDIIEGAGVKLPQGARREAHEMDARLAREDQDARG